jgi:signal transduction histidine kinase
VWFEIAQALRADLGLARTHATVRRHGGAIDVESTVDVGTTFRIWLPRFGLRAV